jgi:hypothetical protein
MHLADAYEEWLKRQSPQQTGTRHQKPPGDIYEAWVGKLVKRRLAKPAAG